MAWGAHVRPGEGNLCTRKSATAPACILFALGLAISASARGAPDIRFWTLGNGARVYFVETSEVPMLQLSAVFDAGAARDTPSRSGLAMLTNTMLKDGAGALDADQIAAAFDDVGAEFSADSQRDMALVNLRSLSDPALLDPAIKVLGRILSVPSFPAAGLKRERERALVALRQVDQSPGDLAARVFYKTLYGTHPYGLNPGGSAAGLRAIARADLAGFYRRYYVGANAVLAMVGDISPAKARQIAERVLGSLPHGSPAPAIPPVANETSAAGSLITHIRFPSSQTHILMGQAGMTRTDPDYFPLLVGNYILGGGGLVSRLADEVREKRGLSYSVYSYFLPMREKGPFIVGLQTRATQRDRAFKVMRATLTRFVTEGPSPAELDAAKKNLSGGFPLRIDSDSKIAEYLAIIGFYGLPLDYLDQFVPKVEAVTATQIREAFRRRVHPGRMVTVIVGGDGR